MKFFVVINFIVVVSSLNLHPDHIPFVLHHHPELNESRINIKSSHCWGYEKNCENTSKYFVSPKGCANKHVENDFILRVDFGYIQQQQKEIMTLCKEKGQDGSTLKCSRYTRYCSGKNIFINFRALENKQQDKFQADLFQPNEIGGFCKVDKELLSQQSAHKSPLQSWYAELENFSELDFHPMLDASHCDLVLNYTVVFMKLDFGGNMFHHFCDFFNLYLSQHVNGSWFGQDIHIVMWDATTSAYFDLFAASWKVFSHHPRTAIMDMKGKRVCIKDVMFPLLPRMREGLFYNTYVPDTCVGSNLFRAFSEHFLYRMNIKQLGPVIENNQPKIRITLLQRGNPKKSNVFRQIRNQPQLVKALSRLENIELKVVEYDWRELPFEEQLEITHNSDVFIGMHGAGLTHFLFLPDWAVAFELYNCGDKHCYYDLARLRGLHYITWPESGPEPVAYDKGVHYRYGENPKFWNWEFDPETFIKLVKEAIKAVLDNQAYKNAIEKKRHKTSVKTEL